MSLPGEFTSGALAGQATEVDTSGRDFGVARVLYEKVGEGRRAIGYLAPWSAMKTATPLCMVLTLTGCLVMALGR